MSRLAQFARQILSTDLYASLMRGVVIVFVIQVFGTGARYVTEVLLARWMGVDQYGIFSYAVSWATVLAVLARLGFDTSVVRFIPEYMVHQEWGLLRGIVNVARLLVISAGAILALIATIVVMLVPAANSYDGALVLGFWLIPFIAMLHLYTEMTRGTQKMVLTYLPPNVLRHLVLLGTAFAFYSLADKHLTAYRGILAVMLGLAAVNVVQTVYLRKALPPPINRTRMEYQFWGWVRVSLPLLLAAASYVVLSRADVLLLGLLRDERLSGIYLATTTVAALVSFGLLAVNAVIGPTISNLYTRKSMDELQSVVIRATVATGGVSIFIAILMILFGRQVLELYGPDFTEGYQALVILCVSQFINACAGPVDFLIHLTGNQVWSARVYAVSAIINVVLGILLIPPFGLVGAAAATALTMVLWNLWFALLVWRRLNLRSFIFLLLPNRTSVHRSS